MILILPGLAWGHLTSKPATSAHTAIAAIFVAFRLGLILYINSHYFLSLGLGAPLRSSAASTPRAARPISTA